MPVILVVEQDASNAERIRDVLLSSGFQVETASSRAEALTRAQAQAPSVLIARSDIPEASELFAAFSLHSGGPGAIELTVNVMGGEDALADESLPESFSNNELLERVQRCLDAASRHQTPAPKTSSDSEQLTSADIFGDMLAEVEAETGNGESIVPVPQSAAPMEDIERRLEETLSGVMPTPSKRPRRRPQQTEQASDSSIEELLDQTLSSLDIPTRAKKPKVSIQETTPEPAATDVSRPTTPATNGSPEAEANGSPEAEASPRHSRAESGLLTEEPPAPFELPPVTAAPVAHQESEVTPGEPDNETPVLSSLPASEDAEAAFEIEIPPELEALETPLEVEPNNSLSDSQPPLDASSFDSPRAESILDADPMIHPQDFQPQEDQFGTLIMPALQVGQEVATSDDFGEYTLLDRIAVGGMAEVWRARRRGVEGFQKIVAIKKILSHLTGSADFVTMFIDEAKLAAQLNHNNIIQIYDLGKVANDFFIAMELVDGKDLRSILTAAETSSQPVPPGLGLLIVSAVARALDYAHRQRDFEDRPLGLVHRDVSPQNVLISYEGEIKLCDFGIVKAVAKASTTQMGALKGKLQYMSPEQAWGKSVDPRSDIFSLGTVLYELLTGTKLFAGESEIGVLDAVRECRIPSPRKSAPDLPREVERIALKALAKNADERYQTAGEMEHEIKAVLDNLKPTPSQKDLTTYLQALFAPQASTVESRSDAPLLNEDSPQIEPAPEAMSPLPQAAAEEAPQPIAPDETAASPSGASRLKWLIAVLITGALIIGGLLFLRSQKTDGMAPPTSTAPDDPIAVEEARPGPTRADNPEPSDDAGEDSGEVETEAAKAGSTGAELSDESGAADPADSPAGAATDLDIEKMVSEELTSRAERLRQDFEAEKKRLEKELAKTQAAEEAAAKTAKPASTESGGDDTNKDASEDIEGEGGGEADHE